MVQVKGDLHWISDTSEILDVSPIYLSGPIPNPNEM